MAADLPLHIFNCHCGRVKLGVRHDLARITECYCSLCWKSGRWHIILDPATPVEWYNQGDMTPYVFGNKRLRHDFSSTCGCFIRVVRTELPDVTRALNVRMIQALEPYSMPPPVLLTEPSSKPPPYMPPSFAGRDFTQVEVQEPQQLYSGACHCGAVTLRLRTRPFSELRVRQCNCSLCWRKAAIQCPLNNIEDLRLHGKEALTLYAPPHLFPILFCKHCGVQVAVLENGQIQLMNLRAFHDIPWDEVAIQKARGREMLPQYEVK